MKPQVTDVCFLCGLSVPTFYLLFFAIHQTAFATDALFVVWNGNMVFSVPRIFVLVRGDYIMQRNPLSRLILEIVTAAAFLLTATHASAEVMTFATFSSISPIKNIRLVNSGTAPGRSSDFEIYTTSSSSATTAVTTQVNFSFLQDGLSSFVSNIVADFTLSATATANDKAITAGPILVQPSISGVMTFKSTSDITLSSPYFATKTFAAGANLLTITFDGVMSGAKNGSNTTLGGSTEGGNVIVFTSDFLDFSTVSDSDLTTSFGALTASLGIDANKSFKSFRATAGGQFSSDPAPVVIGIVPEPVSWVMMITGFAMIGVAVRRHTETSNSLV